MEEKMDNQGEMLDEKPESTPEDIKDIRIFKGFELMEIIYCKTCNSFLYKGKYIPYKDFKENLLIFLKKHLQFHNEPDEILLDPSFLDEPIKKLNLTLVALKRVGDAEIEEEVVLPVRMLNVECRDCSRLKGGYFEGIFQLRNKKNKQYETVKKEFEDDVASRRDVAISKEVELKTGVDLYVTNNKYLQTATARLHKKYGGETATSAKLSGLNKETSKKLYRINLLLRLPEYDVGDIIKWNKEYYKTMRFSGNTITIQNLKTGNTRPIKVNDDFEVVKTSDDFVMMQVTKRKPEIEVLHPETYESTVIQNKVETKEKEIKVVVIDDMVFAV